MIELPDQDFRGNLHQLAEHLINYDPAENDYQYSSINGLLENSEFITNECWYPGFPVSEKALFKAIAKCQARRWSNFSIKRVAKLAKKYKS